MRTYRNDSISNRKAVGILLLTGAWPSQLLKHTIQRVNVQRQHPSWRSRSISVIHLSICLSDFCFLLNEQEQSLFGALPSVNLKATILRNHDTLSSKRLEGMFRISLSQVWAFSKTSLTELYLCLDRMPAKLSYRPLPIPSISKHFVLVSHLWQLRVLCINSLPVACSNLHAGLYHMFIEPR